MSKSRTLKAIALWGSWLLACLLLFATPARSQIIRTVAGGLLPIEGAQATTQFLDGPQSIISDRAGGFYFSTGRRTQHRVYRVAADGTQTTIAGTGPQGFGGDGGPAIAAQLNNPAGLALDAAGNLYIADSGNSRIRKVTSGGIITTVAGVGIAGYSGEGVQAVTTRISRPRGVTVDVNGNMFIADTDNNRIRKVTPAGIISTIAGTGTSGFSGDGGLGIVARLSNPYDVAVDASGTLFIADINNNRVRKLTPNGVIVTVAGSGSLSGAVGDGGPATSAIIGPTSVAVDASGSLWIADVRTDRIRKVGPNGIITTVAGTGSYGFSGDGAMATAAQFANPFGVALDTSANLFIADTGNNRIRKVTPDGVINTVAGIGTRAFSGDGNQATMALLDFPNGIAVDAGGNLFIADTNNGRVRRVTAGGIIGTFAGDGDYGPDGDGGPATSASLYYPGGVALDSAGNVFISDCDRIRKVVPGGTISTIKSAPWYFCDDYYESFIAGGVAVDATGNLILADTDHNRIYKIMPDGSSTVIAGTGAFGFGGDGGPATSASFQTPWGVAIDAAGNIFVADSRNNRIRRITSAGIISTVAGTGPSAFSGDGGPAVSAALSFPSGIAVDAAGNLFIADQNNNRIRKVTPAGIISTVAGNGTSGFSGDGGLATSAQLSSPTNVAVDAVGNLFIADSQNNRIRRIAFNTVLAKVSQNFAGQGTTLNIALEGENFSSPLTIDAGTGITISNISVVSDVRATATLTVAPGAALGPRSMTVSTSLGTSGPFAFTVVPPYPDLSITSSHTGVIGVGFDATYVVGISNVGSAPTTGTITVTDALPTGLTYVSGSGSGWACSSSDDTATCTKPDSLAPGESTSLRLTVAVGAGAASSLTHSPKVISAGDPTTSNDTAQDVTTVAVPVANLRLTPQTVVAGDQATADLTVPTAFPFDVTGTLTLGFSSDAVNPADDPAIQFATGGRSVTFTIPANTLQARFESSAQAGPVGFQPGTVSGTLSFTGTLQTGVVETAFSSQTTIPRQPPKIYNIERESSNGGNFVVGLNLSSTPREVTQMTVRFQTTPSLRLQCGGMAGCSTSGSAFTLDMKSTFDSWFADNSMFGSISNLRVPLFIQGTVRGDVIITFSNRTGTSNSVSVPLP
jgi:uncharacterized repeat protein (TIGR01451 family)